MESSRVNGRQRRAPSCGMRQDEKIPFPKWRTLFCCKVTSHAPPQGVHGISLYYMHSTIVRGPCDVSPHPSPPQSNLTISPMLDATHCTMASVWTLSTERQPFLASTDTTMSVIMVQCHGCMLVSISGSTVIISIMCLMRFEPMITKQCKYLHVDWTECIMHSCW
jgi:hypothetical protein